MLAKFINNNPTSLQETTSENQSCFNLRCIINELYNTMKQRKIDKITSNPWRPGFLGEGHTAKAVVGGQDFEQTDPFIILMDDRVNLPGNESAGGPHPHAGFETVTFVLEGNGREFKTGSVELMTAGKGIVHTEEIKTKTDMRILQLWLALPPGKRWAEPFHQEILAEDTPTLRTANTEIKVYSGSSHGLTSPMINHTPLTLVDFRIEKNSEASQDLPASYNGFIYVVDGAVWVSGKKVEQGQAAWLERSDDREDSIIKFSTENEATRFVLYAAEPHHAPIVSHGPFIGDTDDDIRRLYREFRQGLMPHLNDIPAEKKIKHQVVPEAKC